MVGETGQTVEIHSVLYTASDSNDKDTRKGEEGDTLWSIHHCQWKI